MRRRFDGFEEDTRRYRRPRLIDDDHVGFRLLDPSANVHHQYYLDIPEPPRAPEPYKISGASSSMTRAHRRSSFVILADAIEPTSRSVGGSPTHEQRIIRSPLSPTRVIPGGRSSPFRPRGFKGPLPHAQSRPQSPPVPARRFIQPKSLSQGNSPRKQSLIPQPRGGLSSHRVNLKNKERDKWERRSGRYVTKIPRSSSLKTPAKKTRPAETIRGAKPSTRSVKNNATNVKSGGVVTGNKAGVAGKANGNPAGKSPDKKINRSPTKIPVRYSAFATGGIASNNGGGGGRFIKISDNNSDDKKEINSPTLSSESSSVPATTTDESVVIGSAETSTPVPALQVSAGKSADKSSDKKENDHGLIDLLKHPTKGEGTKSVVSATTTTAVQPLKIDATNIIPDSTVTEIAAVVTSNNDSNNKDDKKSLPEQIKPNSNSKVDNNPEAKAKEEIKTKEESKDVKTKPEDKSAEVQEVQAVVEPINVEAVVKVGNGNEEKKTREDLKIQETKAERSLDEGDKKLKTDETDRAIEAAGSLNPVGDKRQENVSSGNNERTDQGRDKGRNHGSETSLKSSNGLSTGSVESIRSTDTGVSLNTVRGVSSAREKRGTHVVKRSQEIETLSGNVMNVESQRNGEPAIVEVTEPTVAVIQPTDTSQLGAASTKRERFLKWRNSAVKRLQDRWSNTKAKGRNMKCFNFRSHKKNVAQLSQINQQQQQQQQQEPKSAKTKKPSAWSCFKPACCRKVRAGSRIAPAETTTCCRPEKSCCFPCKPISWCRLPSWCSCKKKETTRDIRAKHSLTSVAPPPLSEEQKSKIPDVLIEHNSVMRAAIPCLPVPLAWFCLVWNVLLPGTGTIWSGLFNLCVGQPRFAATSSARSRLGAFIVDIIVGVSQAFTVLFCLVGWGWSIWWGVTMIRLARKWKRFKAAEASSNDLEAGGDTDGGLPAPGVPTQALREMERAR